jgi:hypothetical protein
VTRFVSLASVLLAVLGSRAQAASELVIPALPRASQTFGLVVVGPQTPAAFAARNVVRLALESRQHHVILVPAMATTPQRADVLKLCATQALDGVAFVRIWALASRVTAEVEVRDMNGDLYIESSPSPGPAAGPVVERRSKARFSLTSDPVWPLLGESPPMMGDSASSALPLLRFEDNGEQAWLGDLRLGEGEVYKALGRPDLAERYAARGDLKTGLKTLGGIALGVGLILMAPMVLVAAGCTHDCGRANAYALGAVGLFWGGLGTIVAGAVIDPNPVDYPERLDMARAYNRQRLVTVGGRF